MNPEQLKQFEEMQSQLMQVVDFINSLGSVGTIPFEIESSFKARLGSLSVSSKTAASETQAVNEGGAAQYSVCKAPDGFKQAILDGQLVYIPFFT